MNLTEMISNYSTVAVLFKLCKIALDCINTFTFVTSRIYISTKLGMYEGNRLCPLPSSFVFLADLSPFDNFHDGRVSFFTSPPPLSIVVTPPYNPR